jgi:hypothetical protein
MSDPIKFRYFTMVNGGNGLRSTPAFGLLSMMYLGMADVTAARTGCSCKVSHIFGNIMGV